MPGAEAAKENVRYLFAWREWLLEALFESSHHAANHLAQSAAPPFRPFV